MPDEPVSLRELERLLLMQREFFEKLMRESDLRYEQRFKAQNEAVSTAMVAAEKAVNAALISAERAVSKAEIAADKRFEAVNEFRAMLNSIVASLMPRTEADQRLSAISDRIEALSLRSDERIVVLTARLDKTEGSGTGKREGWGYLVGAVGLVMTLLAIFAWFSTRVPVVPK